MRKRKPVLLNGEALMVDGKVLEFDAVDQEELDGKIDAPQTAQVGEVLTVEEVDEDGKPIKWKTAPGVNITTELTQESTDAQVPSAKAAYDAIGRKIDAPQTANVGEFLAVEEVDEKSVVKKIRAAEIVLENTVLSVADIPNLLTNKSKYGVCVGTSSDISKFKMSFPLFIMFGETSSGTTNFTAFDAAGYTWPGEIDYGTVRFSGKNAEIYTVNITSTTDDDGNVTETVDKSGYNLWYALYNGKSVVAYLEYKNAKGQVVRKQILNMCECRNYGTYLDKYVATFIGIDNNYNLVGRIVDGDYTVDNTAVIPSSVDGLSMIIQSDWTQNDTSAPDYVKNRPGGYDVIESTTISWDGSSTAGGFYYYTPGRFLAHVSDTILSKEELSKAKVYNNDDPDTELEAGSISEGDGYFADFTRGVVVVTALYAKPYGPTTTLDKTGVFFHCQEFNNVRHYTSKLVIQNTKEVKIPAKYLDLEQSLSSKLPIPTTAQVGQIVKVKAVDADGKITETEAVDVSTIVSVAYNEETGNLQIGG